MKIVEGSKASDVQAKRMRIPLAAQQELQARKGDQETFFESKKLFMSESA